jgi:predicted enzyme related to lactoylglutathione lyase
LLRAVSALDQASLLEPEPFRPFTSHRFQDGLVDRQINEVIMAAIPTGRFVWFDYVSNDPRTAQAFFDELFGWKTKDAPMPGRSYTMIAVGDAAIGGYTEPPPANTHWLSYLQVADARATAGRVESLGGTVVKAPFAIGDFATMALVVDPLGAAFALWQPNQVQDNGDYKGVDGAWIWNEHQSDDPDRSVEFYKAIGSFDGERIKTRAGGPSADRHEILKSDGKGRAGIMKLHGGRPQWMPYVKVANADATIGHAKKLGAGVKNVETIAGLGRVAMFIDPLGAPVGILQPERT